MAEKVAAPFLGTLEDTATVLEALRAKLEAVEAQRRALGEEANDLNVRIAAFATLRQAHGLPPA